MSNKSAARSEKHIPHAPSSDATLSVDLSDSLKAFRAATKGKRGRKEFEQLNRWFEIALNNMGRGLSMFDADQRLIVCNKRYREIFSLPAALVEPGTPFADILRYHVKRETGLDGAKELETQRRWISKHMAEMACGKSFSGTRHLQDGRTILVSIQPLPDGGWVDLQEDITEKCLAENKIAWLARHDTLTELANRFYFRELLGELLREREPTENVVLHWIDLDRFKQVNDTLGHPAGDALLKSVAKRLREVLRSGDIVARLGGDEFAVIQRDAHCEEQAAHLAGRIIRSISHPHQVLGHTVEVGASVGIVVVPASSTNVDEIIKCGDIALYEAKAAGRGTYRVFKGASTSEAPRRRSLETDLQSALANGELELHYQPILNASTRDIAGFEALLRWQHPSLGTIEPGDFIPLAESTGLIEDIGAWVLNEACQAAGWSKDVKVTVNLSPVQFERGDLFHTVLEALERAGLPARRLELEITEAVLLRDSFETSEVLHKLRGLGVSIALDEFGTAYASLSYLRSFPFDKIKIDRSFVRNVDRPECGDCAALITAVTGIARQLDIKTVAEGVETAGHVNAVIVSGCDEVQGYYFSRPVPAADVEGLLGRAESDREGGTARQCC